MFIISPAGNSCGGGVGKIWDKNRVIETDCEYNRMWVAYNGAPLTNPMIVNGSHANIYLKDKQKIIGRVTVNMGDFFPASSQWWSTNRYNFQYDPEATGTLIGDFNKTITLINTPTCSASVNDVTFPGTPTPSAIAAGTVTPQTATVSVTCDDILPKYTIKVSSPNGTQGSATDGVIKSNNPTVGYRLSWKEGQVANAGSNIQLDSVLTPATLPTQSTFTLPISVKPVALVPQGSITAGPANSAVKIDLTFN